MSSRQRPRAHLSRKATGGRDDWRSPPRVLDPMVAAFGQPGLDPCASSHPEHHFAAVNLSAEVDGLTLPWAPICRGSYAFANYPYSRSAPWVDKALAEVAAGCAVILLCAARPGVQWYRRAKAQADALCEIEGRLHFLSGDPGPPVDVGGAPFPSALLGFNVSWRRFARAFEALGSCEVPR